MTTKPTPDAASSSLVMPGDLQDAIRRRAGEIYEKSGMLEGHDLENWTRAEAEIRKDYREREFRRAALVLRVDGIKYVGEYSLASSGGYTPGEFSTGSAVPVRFDGDKMFVTRRNGRELETRIVQRLA